MSDLHQPPQSLVPETPPWETPSLVPETPPWETPSLVPETAPWETPSLVPETPPWETPSLVLETPQLAQPLPGRMVLVRLRPSRTGPLTWCGAAFCCLFSILLIVFGVATLIIFHSVRPKIPIVEVSDATLNTILFGSQVHFDGDMLLQLNVTNPNKKQGVRLENLSVELWFEDTKIATQGILPFSLRNGKTRLELIRLVSDSIVLPVNHMVELRRQVASNEIDYEVRSTSKVKAALGIIHYSYWLNGSCRLQLTSPPAGSLLSRNCTTKRW